MNSASNHYNAETKAGRPARGLARAALACALACMALGSGAALAQHDRGDRGDQPMQQERHGGERFQLPPQDREQRQAEMRAFDEQRRQQQQYQQQMQQQVQQEQRRSSGRMTPDERRDLRRQINEANMDLYPQRR
jgi:hypothetical protein